MSNLEMLGKKLYDLLLDESVKHSDKPQCSCDADVNEIGKRSA